MQISTRLLNNNLIFVHESICILHCFNWIKAVARTHTLFDDIILHRVSITQSLSYMPAEGKNENCDNTIWMKYVGKKEDAHSVCV